MATIEVAWGTVRASLGQLSFSDIRDVAGLAGVDVTELSHLQQKSGNGVTKDQLRSAIDGLVGLMEADERRRFVMLVAEEVLSRRPNLCEELEEKLARHGWGLVDNRLIPLELFDPAELTSLPEGPREDLVKAALRFRDGDLSGAIAAACGAVDTAVAAIYDEYQLGEPAQSFQEGCNRAVAVVMDLDAGLRELGWDADDVKIFANNFKGALTRGAYVMQTLRSKMGDVHGSKPVLKPLVFDVLKWAELFVRTLTRPQ
ncbi:hypothetical protein OIV57_23030 [Burkholderia pseudomallei]|uniref:hypothetical protein n=1 Tax=Burkholderia pseudomallei TaxID=28450 RepID=UPI001052F004|nr:hypothetical protein [Burkholderia pseudomallei]MCV9915010.1 hypothetical protein [Burkholderia pseudomallei]MCW0071048.1 hypothetical protein [Burkholderia pseudomallei]TCW75531.1 hypothetical protein C5O80_37730 [Burkholderia sp. SRS-46]